MANICDFKLSIYGQQEQLDALKEMILGDTEPTTREFVFDIKVGVWGNDEGNHEFIWIQEIKYYRCEAVLGDYLQKKDELRIIGEAKYCPPLVFAEQVMKKFPECGVDLHGTTEHELYEHWQSRDVQDGQGQRLVCRFEQITNLENDEILRVVIDGQQILPRAELESVPNNLDEQEN